MNDWLSRERKNVRSSLWTQELRYILIAAALVAAVFTVGLIVGRASVARLDWVADGSVIYNTKTGEIKVKATGEPIADYFARTEKRRVLQEAMDRRSRAVPSTVPDTSATPSPASVTEPAPKGTKPWGLDDPYAEIPPQWKSLTVGDRQHRVESLIGRPQFKGERFWRYSYSIDGKELHGFVFWKNGVITEIQAPTFFASN